MNWSTLLPIIILSCSFLTALIIFGLREEQRTLRTTVNIGAALLKLTLIIILLIGVYNGLAFETRLPLLPNMDLVLRADELSLLFVSLSGILWLLTTVYAVGYLEDSPNRSRFFGFFSLCVTATMGIALAGNLITFLIFYELLTLVTYPLVVHRGTPASLRAGRIYLAYTMVGGALLLTGVVWLKTLVGSLDFSQGAMLSSVPDLDPTVLIIIFALLIAGVGVKAALVPFHGWLPVAMAAPAPVSALLHAVAVVKAGAFGIVRIVYDVYGIEFAQSLGVTFVLAGIAAITIVYGSVRALSQNDLKKRLAFSTVSQVSYIALGASIAGPMATIGGIVHLVHQGLMKITLFFCAGNLAETLQIHKVSEMNGVGKRMPWTMAAFTIAALGMIGIPPIAGFVSKWYLGIGAAETGHYWVVGVLAISSLLNAAYFLPLIYAAWFRQSPSEWPEERHLGRFETHWMLLFPPLITALMATLAGVFAAWFASPLSWSILITAREYGVEFATAGATSFGDISLLWLAVLTPLGLALSLTIAKLRALVWFVFPIAAVPALLLTLFFKSDAYSFHWLFLGSTLAIDELGRLFLLLAGILWFVAALYARDYMNQQRDKMRFCLFFLLAMAGNFGLILSQDAFGFITFFTLMSLSSYGLVIHSGESGAIRAGQTYIQWVILGEVLLFAAMTWLAYSADSVLISDLADVEKNLWVMLALLAGFGIKMGMLPLHMWLPRAHPVAPVPASAVLSGIMVKAGLLGWLRFLPADASATASVDLGLLLMSLGLCGTFFGIAAGIMQRNPKALLAYSTISQMGIITSGVGVGMTSPDLWPVLLPAILLYAIHHGLAKCALFLSTDLAPQLSPRNPYGMWFWMALALPAAALAGVPFTSGALAKTALKTALYEWSTLSLLLSVSAVGTTLLMLRFAQLMREKSRLHSGLEPIHILRTFSYATLLVVLALMVYTIPSSAQFLAETLSVKAWFSVSWPVLAGVAIYAVARSVIDRLPEMPAGDVAVFVDRSAPYVSKRLAFCSGFWSKKLGEFGGIIGSRSFAALSNNNDSGSPARAATTFWKSPGLVIIAVLVAIVFATVY